MPPDRRLPRSVTTCHKRQDGPRESYPETEADFADFQIFDRDRVTQIVFQFWAVDQAVTQSNAPIPIIPHTKPSTGIQYIADLEAALGRNGVRCLVERDPVAQIGDQQADSDKWADDVVGQEGIDARCGDGDDGWRGDLDAD